MKITQITQETSVEAIRQAITTGQVECRDIGEWWELSGGRLTIGKSRDGSWYNPRGRWTPHGAAQEIMERINSALS